jgi:transcriptional regulator GlxA family with amidase domain
VHLTTTWTLSVGIGSGYLAATGALDGAPAAPQLCRRSRLTETAVTQGDEQVVQAGKVATSAGASAGIDLTATLLALGPSQAVAQTVQLPPSTTSNGSDDAAPPAKAPADIGELVNSYYAQRCTDVSDPECPLRHAHIAIS